MFASNDGAEVKSLFSNGAVNLKNVAVWLHNEKLWFKIQCLTRHVPNHTSPSHVQ